MLASLSERVAKVEVGGAEFKATLGHVREVAEAHVEMDRHDHALLGKTMAENHDRIERKIEALGERIAAPVAKNTADIDDLRMTRAQQRGAARTLAVMGGLLSAAGGGIGGLLVYFGLGR